MIADTDHARVATYQSVVVAERITQQRGGEDPVSSANLAKEEQIKPLIRFDTIGPAIDLIDAAKLRHRGG